MTSIVAMCRCGHTQDVHDHYRPGSDCGSCGTQRCPRFEAHRQQPVCTTTNLHAYRSRSAATKSRAPQLVARSFHRDIA